jgi:hypothetical protein
MLHLTTTPVRAAAKVSLSLRVVPLSRRARLQLGPPELIEDILVAHRKVQHVS